MVFRIYKPEVLTCCSKLGVQPLAQMSLNPQARTDKGEANKCQSIRPCRIISCVRDASLTALPECECGCHCKQCLQECSRDEPDALVRSKTVAYTTNEGACVEGNQGAKRLLIRLVESLVAKAWRPLEETS